MNGWLWWTMAIVGLGGSALYSGLETGVYQLNRVRLHLLVHREDRRAEMLNGLMKRPNRVLGTLLIGNNAVNYLASMGITGLLGAAGFKDWGVVLITAVILTPMLFVFGEVLPKDLFRRYTDRLTYRCARMLWLTQLVVRYTGLGPVIDWISHLIGRVLGVSHHRAAGAIHPRRVVNQLMKEGIDRGLISDFQSEMIDRVLYPTEQTVRQAMIPWDRVTTVRVGMPPEAVWSLADRTSFGRLPIVDDAGRLHGVLYALDVLRQPPDATEPLEALRRSVTRLEPDTSLHQALRQMRAEHSAMAVVMSDDEVPRGIVTVKDLVEPITGDLMAW